MEFQVLGQISARCGPELIRPTGRLGRTLLAVLLARCDAPITADTLTEVMWPDTPVRQAAHRLQVHVSRLRATLGDQRRLRFDQGSYQLRVLPDELDAARFRTLTDEAADVAVTDPDRCVALSRKAMDLWQGEPYTGVDVPVVNDEVARLRERRLVAQEVCYRAELSLGRHAAILADLAAFATAHPLHERAQGLLITAFSLCGRRAEALAAYDAVCHRLADELGVGPGPELRDLHRRVVDGAPMVPVAA
jgi:DNA-binding SARP family transcriptional activator